MIGYERDSLLAFVSLHGRVSSKIGYVLDLKPVFLGPFKG